MLKTVSKGIAGAAATALGATATFIVIPEGVEMPWWGYLVAGALNAGLGFAVVYYAPRNTN